ncbi:ABC-2 family transporter protein [candidate division WWE3 bacterium]|uniref:ABC-2 family transporter protein n=1 Tax=candidate division WWE3 bacterium TaxID=2053526 RepID=A0A955LKU3_UNCKA|nr:ABC-2 family transporter protein [candidate division WWE3 bacterium]
MNHSVIKRYIKLYLHFFRFTIIQKTQYRFSFFIEIFIELGYLLWTIVFFSVVYSNINAIAGWTYDEMLILVGLSMIFGQLLIGLFYVWNHRVLPERIKDASIDFTLLKPINNMFALTAANTYPGSFIAAIAGIVLIARGLVGLNIVIQPLNVIVALVLLINSLIVGYAIFTIITSFAFKFINASFLPDIANDLVNQFSGYPASVYKGVVKILLFSILPVLYAASFPAESLIRGVPFYHVVWSFVLAVVFLLLAKEIWDRMIKLYSSASS